MNGEVEVDDPLSKSTSRLSICQADMEELGKRILDYKFENF